MNKLFIKAILAFFTLPFIVAFLIPITIGHFLEIRNESTYFIAMGIIFIGSYTLYNCIKQFYIEGKGTLAPWAPPTKLITSGPYKHSRNPMYIAVVIIVSGWALYYCSLFIAIEAIILIISFHLRICLYEEKEMERLFPTEWQTYKQNTSRWIGF